MSRLLAIDLGSRRIGLALADTLSGAVRPLATVRRAAPARDAQTLARLVAEQRIDELVVGLPLNMDGSEGPRAQSTRTFAANLSRLTDLPIAMWDERLSTAAVERALIEADRSRARRAALIDKLAAAYILQGALDRLANMGKQT